jgi:hypothetical protein
VSKRRITYGYLIRNGETVSHPIEADVVRRIFQSYLDGESFQRLADVLNRDEIPFSEEAPIWDKHKVKRVLEQSRYIGQGRYPQIIHRECFQAVQEKIASKRVMRKPREAPTEKLAWERLTCSCGKRFQRRIETEHEMELQCNTCGINIKLTKQKLRTAIAAQMEAMNTVPNEQQQGNLARTINAIDRCLEQPKNPQEAIRLVLQGISARYSCCTITPQIDDPPGTVDWGEFSRKVTLITVLKNGEIQLQQR